MNRKLIVLIPLVLCACGRFSATPQSTPEISQVARSTAAIAFRHNATATVDDAQTQRAHALATERAADVIISGNIAEQKRADADKAQADAVVSGNLMALANRTATAYPPAATGTMAYQRTQAAQLSARNTAQSVQWTATAEYPQVIERTERGKMAGVYDALIGFAIAVGAVAGLVVVIIILHHNAQYWQYHNNRPAPVAPAQMAQDEQKGDLPAPELDEAKIRAFLHLAYQGGDMGIQAMYPDLADVMSRGDVSIMCRFFRDNKLSKAVPDVKGGGVRAGIAMSGIEWGDRWNFKHPLPYRGNLSQEAAPVPVQTFGTGARSG